jgi:hypothetical protein
LLVSEVPCPMCSQLVTLLLELALCRLLVQAALMLLYFLRVLTLSVQLDRWRSIRDLTMLFLVLGAIMMWPMQFFSRLLLS